MIHDLDKTLKKLLERELSQILTSEQIKFDTPDDQFSPQPPALDLFLYDVRENRDLRSNEWLVERRSNGTAIKKAPPVRVDCSYLISAWGSDAEDEHRILGEVMRVLLRYPTIPAEILQGSLVVQEPPLPATTLQPGHLQSLGEFWQALGGKPKAALNYTVTIGVEPHKPVEVGAPVTDKRLRFINTEEGA